MYSTIRRPQREQRYGPERDVALQGKTEMLSRRGLQLTRVPGLLPRFAPAERGSNLGPEPRIAFGRKYCIEAADSRQRPALRGPSWSKQD
jgi:hypothetical protein